MMHYVYLVDNTRRYYLAKQDTEKLLTAPLPKLIYNFNHYTAMAERCWSIYTKLDQIVYFWTYYKDLASIYEEAILAQL